ncbi:MAG: hypothetical protein O7F17_03750 [Planctomycetota bacterium]|nr:hypothetical protein [Planctomycetota bacterium]MCZ6493283.1 hypothetical protein [Planctomycetota bacterium]MCZ6850732.1 hypothetical protein [Planctomycetota bacterium]
MTQQPISGPNPPRQHPGEISAGMPAKSDTQRAVRRIVPWVVSVGLHAGIIVLGFLLTWTVMSGNDEQAPTRVTAEFYALNYDPLVTLASDPTTIDEPFAPQSATIESLEQAIADQLADLEPAPLSLIAETVSAAHSVQFAPPPTHNSATFVGLTSTNARRIVYVIDASGSMIRSLQIVLEELARSLDPLTPPQEMGIIFFQRNQAVMVPPRDHLVAATPQAKVQALRWIDEQIIPAGRSNPLAAIEKALRFKPDVIFLLSDNITGSGQFGIDQKELLDLLEQLNPIDAQTGRRATRINCAQFLYPDPLDTLRKIAERHGGPQGYTFLDAAALGIAAP